jgi:hypothetical protein
VKCRELMQELEDFLDNDLDATLRAEIALHLDRCGDCRLVVDTTRKTIQIFCKTGPLPMPEDTRQRLHDALRRHCSQQHPQS